MKELVPQLLKMIDDYRICQNYYGQENNVKNIRSDIEQLINSIVEESQSTALSEKRYEELREVIDGGSESMGHIDAVEQVKYWRDRSAQWVGMRWMPINPTEAMDQAYYKSIKEHGSKNFFPVWIDVVNEACKSDYGHNYFPPIKESI